MDALDLAIEDRVWIDDDIRMGLEPLGKPRLGGAFGLADVRAKRGVVGEPPKLSGMPGPPFGPSYLITMTSPALIFLPRIALIASCRNRTAEPAP